MGELMTHRHEGYFVLRSPLLPLQTLHEILEAGNSDAVDALLKSALNDPVLREALWISSTSLYDAAMAWLAGTLSPQNVERLRRGLLQYLARGASRSTPFGLWAGVSIGSMGETTVLQLHPRDGYSRSVRLDAAVLETVARRLHDEHPNPPVRLNSSAYRRADRYFFVRRRPTSGLTENELTSIVTSPYIELVAETTASGSRFEVVLAQLQAFDPEPAREDFAAFLNELRGLQFLVPGIGAVQIGRAPTELIDDWCRAEPSDHGRVFFDVQRKLEHLSSTPLGADPAAYRMAVEPLQLETSAERAIQVDLWKPADLTLSEDLMRRVAETVNVAFRIRPRTDDALADFRARFVERYGTAAVPLMEVLDEETGIPMRGTGALDGYREPLLKDFKPHVHDETAARLTARDSVLLDRLHELWSSRATVWNLSSADVEKLASQSGASAPDSFYVLIRLMRQKESDDPEFELRTAAGPGSTPLLARFAHMDATLASHVRKASARSWRDTIMEIVHVPEDRLGNVMFRPSAGSLELPYLALSAAAPESQVRIGELLVTVEDDAVRLLSPRHGAYVSPVINHAVVFWRRSNLPVFQFLGMLQQQESASWSWGAFSGAAFLPRVVLGSAVLARATWKVTGDHPSVEGLIEELRRRGVPDEFAVLEAGGEVTEMTLENRRALSELLRSVRNGGSIVVTESLARSQAVVGSADGDFVQECIIPFRRESNGDPPPSRAFTPRADRIQPPGSRWTTAKIYTGPAEVDRILRDDLGTAIAEVGDELLNHHFVRYADPDHHVRIRFETLAAEAARAAMDRLFANVIPNRAIRVTYDSYRSESWRYGGAEALPAVERLFTHDSDAIRQLLMHEDNGGSRWLAALLDVHVWLDAFGLDANEKITFVEKARDRFMQEFRIKSVGAMSAMVSRELVAEGSTALDDARAIPHARSAFSERAAKSAAIIDQLRAMAAKGELTRPLHDILWSLIHMSVNRLLRTQPRQQEACLYHVLTRHYVAQAKRGAR